MKQNGGDYFCKSCSEEVVDFRGRGELQETDVNQVNLCGIFDKSQLPAQKEMSFRSKGLFYALAFCSFLGFSVQQAKANKTVRVQNDSLVIQEIDSVNIKVPDSLNFEDKVKESEVKNRRRRRWFRKRKEKPVMGFLRRH